MCLGSESSIIVTVQSGRVLAISLHLFVCLFFADHNLNVFSAVDRRDIGEKAEEVNLGARITLVFI